MKYDKLIRDQIAQNLIAKGKKVLFHEASEEEYEAKLLEKLSEEVREFQEAKNSEELADVREVLEALERFYKIDSQEVQVVKEKKQQEKGGFDRKIILEEVID